MWKEIRLYLWENKKWWMIPPVVVFVVLALLVAVSLFVPMNPFVYILF